MVDIDNIIRTIDTSKMVKDGVDFYNMCESEFEIYEWLQQPKGNERLTYCYYHRWICTDTEVGLMVWYFDNEPVCISYKPYRKSYEYFGWVSKEKFNEVRNYALSLKDGDDFDVDIIDDETIDNIVEQIKSIDYKKFEELNVK